MKISPQIQRRQRCRGFSLVEMLVVLAVIGVVTAISVGTISSITEEATRAQVQGNAQMLALISGQALHAGNEDLVAAGSVAEAVRMLSEGVVGAGDFADVNFGLILNEEEQAKAVPRLTYSNGLLIMKPVE